jgi:hypothetical protein
MQVFNKKYWPHQFRVLPQEDPWTQTYEIERFCYESFKSENWRNVGLYFVFKKEQDASYFLLRWGG